MLGMRSVVARKWVLWKSANAPTLRSTHAATTANSAITSDSIVPGPFTPQARGSIPRMGPLNEKFWANDLLGRWKMPVEILTLGLALLAQGQGPALYSQE